MHLYSHLFCRGFIFIDVIRIYPIVEQELLTLPENLSEGLYSSIFRFLSANILCVFLSFTASDYAFGIFILQ